MKDLTLVIEYVTHALSAGRAKPEDQHDSFERDNAGNIVWRQPWWHAAMLKAIELSGIKGVKPAYFYFEPTVKAETSLFRRKYGRDKFRVHESIMPGSSMTVKALVDDSLGEKQLMELFTFLGRYVGLSPFGYNLGYGKFEIKELKLTGRSDDGHNAAQPIDG